MPYKFTFDFSKIPRFFFAEVTKIGCRKGLHKKFGKTLHALIKKFRIQEITGLNLSDAVLVLQDFIEIYAINLLQREKFETTKKRALFLPHCSRKYMDNRCKAFFNPEKPSYICLHCSPECLINKSVTLAQKKGYAAYILPGGSCIPKILELNSYDGIIGVACGEEINAIKDKASNSSIAGQAILLTKNGCANTVFNIESLLHVL